LWTNKELKQKYKVFDRTAVTYSLPRTTMKIPLTRTNISLSSITMTFKYQPPHQHYPFQPTMSAVRWLAGQADLERKLFKPWQVVMKKKTPFLAIPPEVHLLIFEWLNPIDAVCLSIVK